jgi:signal transduction histidine kinase
MLPAFSRGTHNHHMASQEGAIPSGSPAARDLAARVAVVSMLVIFIGAVYAAVVLGLGAILDTETPNTALSAVAMTLVALTFGGARQRADRLVARLLHGQRATPYEVLAGLSERAAQSYAPEEALPRMAELIAAGTGAVRVEVWLRVDGELLLGASWPTARAARRARLKLPMVGLPAFPAAARAVAVSDRNELLGAITIAKRPGEQPSGTEERLLADVASQAGLVLRNVRLTAELSARLDELQATTSELRASRRRIVEAQDSERRRLERDIHDGAQQHLVALAVKLRMARTFAEKDPKRTRTMIGEVRTLTEAALENLRDLTSGIYPQVLAAEGVQAALKSNLDRAALPVSVSGGNVRRFDPAAEIAVYFCCLEAIQNAAKHAGATSVRVRLERTGGEIVFSVVDDGAGFDASRVKRGSGLQNMEDRLAVIGGRLEITSTPGGGTTLIGYVPAGAPEGTA